MDETTLSRIVNGFREPSPELQTNIAGLLKCEVEWLFKRQDTASERTADDGHDSVARP